MIEPIGKSSDIKTGAEVCPKGYHALTPSLTCSNPKKEIEFLTQALGARERYHMDDPDTKRIGHAELEIGDSVFMLGEAHADMGCKTAQELGGSPVAFYLYVSDADAAFARATKAGAKVKDAVKDMFWGDRVGTVIDPEGYCWSLATHKRDLKPEEIAEGYKRFKKELATSGKK